MRNQYCSDVFLENLIDYAGLFPPANLSLTEAVTNYASYINSEDDWMLGPFVLPVTRINEIHVYENLFSSQKPLLLSIVGRKSESEQEFVAQLKEDFAQINSFMLNSVQWLRIDAFEAALPPIVPNIKFLESISAEAAKLEMKVFCEVPLLKNQDWKKELTSTLDQIASFNINKKNKLGVKLRTGGIQAEMFPSAEQVAFVLGLCRERNLALKFTAGLHHPIRMFRNEVNTKMHGFLNIFLGGMLAYSNNLEEETIVEILSDENKAHFSISPDRLSWRNFSITSQEIKVLRKSSLCSFGSCSFVEPRDEFEELIKQQEVIK